MTKKELVAAVENAKAETKSTLQMVYNALNHGQRQKLLWDEAVKSLLDYYGLEYGSNNCDRKTKAMPARLPGLLPRRH